MQIHQHDNYAKLSKNNQVKILPNPPKRGLIYDRNKIILAENLASYSLQLTPGKLKLIDLNNLINKISEIIQISTEEREEFFQRLKTTPRSHAVTLKLQLSEEELAKLAIKQYLFPEIKINADLKRYYPFAKSHAHVLGYIGLINKQELQNINSANYQGTYLIGKTGIEKFYETKLHGKIGYQSIEVDARGRQIKTLANTAAISGEDLYLTIDSDLQNYIYNLMQSRVGAAIVLNPKTGDILALVSNPSFDANEFISNNFRKIQDLIENKELKPLFNRAIQGTFSPGSTIKPLIALHGLDKNLINYNTSIYDPGWFQLPNDNRIFHDWKREGHGWIDLEHAISSSCTTFFYKIAHQMGIKDIAHTLQKSGLGKLTNIDLPGEKIGLVPTPEWKLKHIGDIWYPGETISVGIGQSYLSVTPIQMAQVAAMIANHGIGFKPKLLANLKPEINLNYPSEHWDYIIQAMTKTIQDPEGTANYIKRGMQYTMAGKTGTAQVFGLKAGEKYIANKLSKNLRDNAWFIGFAPVENPEIAFAILLEHDKGSASIARKICDFYLLN